jgi:hypothetical protein
MELLGTSIVMQQRNIQKAVIIRLVQLPGLSPGSLYLFLAKPYPES